MSEAKTITVPDLGSDAAVDVIEVLVSPGDTIKKDDSLLTLETDKATMEVPAPEGGVVEALLVKVGDKVKTGSVILQLRPSQSAEAPVEKIATKTPEPTKEKQPEPAKPVSVPAPVAAPVMSSQSEDIYASPIVRRVAREFGVDLSQISGSGPKQRILKEDIQAYVKSRLSQSGVSGSGLSVATMPVIDFSKYGEIETLPLKKIKRLTGINVHRAWVTIPHVTQFDEADITEMEAFREENKSAAAAQGVKLTPLVFIMKAVVKALQAFPSFNASLDASGENLIFKKYYHLGVAVDTPNGLVVPVVRNVDQKGFLTLAAELHALSAKAREKGLTPAEMEGSTFTISSLGGISGVGFTPIVNAPDVAILGVSKSKWQPVYQDGNFVPRLILPYSLSYDHRVIDGAEAARFTQYLSQCLTDIRRLLL